MAGHVSSGFEPGPMNLGQLGSSGHRQGGHDVRCSVGSGRPTSCRRPRHIDLVKEPDDRGAWICPTRDCCRPRRKPVLQQRRGHHSRHGQTVTVVWRIHRRSLLRRESTEWARWTVVHFTKAISAYLRTRYASAGTARTVSENYSRCSHCAARCRCPSAPTTSFWELRRPWRTIVQTAAQNMRGGTGGPLSRQRRRAIRCRA